MNQELERKRKERLLLNRMKRTRNRRELNIIRNRKEISPPRVFPLLEIWIDYVKNIIWLHYIGRYDLIRKYFTKYFSLLDIDFVPYYCISFIINKNTGVYLTHKIHSIPYRFLFSEHGVRAIPSFVTCFVTNPFKFLVSK